MKAVRLHPFQFGWCLRWGLVLCVIPVARALFVFDILAAYHAFTQSLAILLAVSILAYLLWRHSSAELCGDVLAVRSGLFYLRQDSYRIEQLSAVVLQQPVLGRLFGATRLTVYFKSEKPVPCVALWLPTRAAKCFADRLLLVEQTDGLFEPAGFDKLIFVMLSANLIATAALVTMTAYRMTRVFGDGVENVAKLGFSQLRHLFAAFLPAGVSALLTLIFMFLLISLARGAGAAWNFSVSRSANLLLCRGGLFTKCERRILVNCINSSSIHVTPWARVLRRYPVYVTAGGFQGHELPLVTVKAGQEEAVLRHFLPEFCLPQKPMCNPRRRHLGSFLWQGGLILGSFTVLLLVSFSVLPAISWALGLGLLFGLCLCVVGLEAFFKEGVCKNKNRTFSLCYYRFFTRYLVSVYTNDFSLEMRLHPLAASEGRCDLRLFTPSRSTYRVRSVEYSVANRLRFNI